MKKIKKNQLIITALAIMIAAAGYINYTGNLSDIITVNDTVRVFRNRVVWYSLRVTVCLQVWFRKQS